MHLGHQSTEGLAPAVGQEVGEELEVDLGHLEVEGHGVGLEIDRPEQRKQTVISMYMYSVCVYNSTTNHSLPDLFEFFPSFREKKVRQLSSLWLFTLPNSDPDSNCSSQKLLVDVNQVLDVLSGIQSQKTSMLKLRCFPPKSPSKKQVGHYCQTAV